MKNLLEFEKMLDRSARYKLCFFVTSIHSVVANLKDGLFILLFNVAVAK